MGESTYHNTTDYFNKWAIGLGWFHVSTKDHDAHTHDHWLSPTGQHVVVTSKNGNNTEVSTWTDGSQWVE